LRDILSFPSNSTAKSRTAARLPSRRLLFLVLVAFATVGAAEPLTIGLTKRTWQRIPNPERTAHGRMYVSCFT
jgi:hypothetical protein